ncbi:hypothetical protein V8B97DRAFT_2026631 [Scleroderma yunnanense]
MLDAFALTDRVALISGENSGLGLAMATALYEAEARDVYCLDLPMEPSEEFRASREYVSKLSDNSRLEYFTTDARDQQNEGTDICIAAAAIVKDQMDCLEYLARQFREAYGIIDGYNIDSRSRTQTHLEFFLQQTAGRQIPRFGSGGSITLIASILGIVASKGPTEMTAAVVDRHPQYLDEWSSMNPLGRIGRPESPLCTGSNIIVIGGYYS